MCFIWVAEQPLVRVEHLENCLTMVSELPECGLLIYGQAENQCCSNYTKGVDADSKMLAWQRAGSGVCRLVKDRFSTVSEVLVN